MTTPTSNTRILRSLSPVELGLLFHYFFERKTAFVDQMACDLVGPLDTDQFQSALEELVARHESLRTCYLRGRGSKLMALICKATGTPVQLFDFSADQDPRAIVEQQLEADLLVDFDLSRQVSMCKLYQIGQDRHIFSWTYHHAVADSWTLRILQEQFCEVYLRQLNKSKPVANKATNYSTYVDWVAAQDRSQVLTEWSTYLCRYPSRQVKDVRAESSTCNRVCLSVVLPRMMREQVNQLRRMFKVTTNTILFAMWALVALDQQQAKSCLLGCVVFGRSIALRGIESVTGVCANTVPIVIDRNWTLREAISNLQSEVFRADAKSYLAISEVLATVGLSHNDLHSVVNFTIDEPVVRNKHADELPFKITNLRYRQAANFDAYLDIDVGETKIVLTINFDPDTRHFSESEVYQKCEQILRCLGERCDDVVEDVLNELIVAPDAASVEFNFEMARGRENSA